MKKLLGALSLSIVLFVASMKAETKDATHHHAKHATSKTDKTAKHKPHEKDTKHQHKNAAAKKEHATAEHRKANVHQAKKPHHAAKENSAHADEIVGKTADGKPVFEGAHTGHYYKNAAGHREYVQNFDGAKIIGKTHDGRNIYLGPRGGHFYYTATGNKEYIQH